MRDLFSLKLLLVLLLKETCGYYIQSGNGNIPGIGSIENLDNLIASAAQSSPFSFALPLPLSMMGSTMSQLLSSPAMALNRLRSASQPLMIEIPNHVLNDFNAAPDQFQVMPLHQCKYCSGSKGKGGSGLKGPVRYGMRKQQQFYGKARPQVNPYPVKSSGQQQQQQQQGYRRPPVQQQPIHQYPMKGGYNQQVPSNQKIVVVVLHMKNDKLHNNLNPGGTKGSSFSRGDEQQQQILSQMRYAAPSTSGNHHVYFEPSNQRFSAPLHSAPLIPTPAAAAGPTAPTIRPDNVPSGHHNHDIGFNNSPLSDNRPAREGDGRSPSFHNNEEEIITQTKEDESSYSPTTSAPVRF